MCKKQQIFGQYFTAFQHDENNPIEGLKNKRIIVSNGPFLNFSLVFDNKEYFIGESVTLNTSNSKNQKATLKYECLLESQIIPLNNKTYKNKINLKLIIGNINKKKINKIKLDTNKNLTDITLMENLFIALLLTTNKGDLALTNPIFIKEVNINLSKNCKL